MTTFLESYAQRAEKRAHHARAQVGDAKAGHERKRAERRASAATKRAMEEQRAADSWADFMAGPDALA